MITFYLLNWSKENCNFETQWNSMIENIGTHRTYCSLFGMLGSSFYSTVKYEKRLSNGYKLYLNGFAKLVSLSSSINSIWMNTDEKKHDITKHKNSRCEYVHQRYSNWTNHKLLHSSFNCVWFHQDDLLTRYIYVYHLSSLSQKLSWPVSWVRCLAGVYTLHGDHWVTELTDTA